MRCIPKIEFAEIPLEEQELPLLTATSTGNSEREADVVNDVWITEC